MSYLIFNKLITLKEQIDVLKIKFKELKLLSYPDSNIELVIDFMNDITTKIDARLTFYRENGINNAELRLISQLIQIFYERVGCITNCDVRNHPREIMIPIKEILSYTSKKHVFITEPIWVVNYSVGTLLNKQYKDALIACGVILNNDIDVIKLSLPKFHNDDVLGGAIMSHELGHYFDLHYSLDLSEKIIVKLMSLINTEKYIKNFYSTIDDLLRNTDELKILLKSNMPGIILRDWINEVVADILGVVFYGTASYFALENLSIYYTDINSTQTQFIQKFSITHPRDSFRNYIRHMTLSKLGHLDAYDANILDKLDEYDKQWKESITEPFRATNYKINDLVTFVVNNNYLLNLENDIKANLEWIINSIVEEINIVSSNLIYSSDKFIKEVPALVEKIKTIVPPNEIKGIPVDSISIINAGWITYILHFEEIKSKLNNNGQEGNDVDVKNLINDLLKKATLASNIHRRWANAIS